MRRFTLAAALLAVGAVAAVPTGKPWLRYHDRLHRFSVRYPSTWHRAHGSLTPSLTSPAEILSLGTGRLPADGGRCAQVPVSALEAVGRSGAFVTLQEADRATRDFPRRPKRFILPAPERRSEILDCLAHRHRPRIYRISFRDNRRAFYALVALGRSVSSTTRAQAVEILESLRFD